jgi:hypothetical protein
MLNRNGKNSHDHLRQLIRITYAAAFAAYPMTSPRLHHHHMHPRCPIHLLLPLHP